MSENGEIFIINILSIAQGRHPPFFPQLKDVLLTVLTTETKIFSFEKLKSEKLDVFFLKTKTSKRLFGYPNIW